MTFNSILIHMVSRGLREDKKRKGKEGRRERERESIAITAQRYPCRSLRLVYRSTRECVDASTREFRRFPRCTRFEGNAYVLRKKKKTPKFMRRHRSLRQTNARLVTVRNSQFSIHTSFCKWTHSSFNIHVDSLAERFFRNQRTRRA